MKRLFFRLFMLTLLALGACAPHPDSAEVSGDTQTRIPVPQKDGSYALEVVKLTGLNNLFELSGQFARFVLSPRIVDGHLDGVSPRGHFVKSGSLYVAADQLSLQMTTIYAHMQKFAALDEELGAGGVNKWPRDIGVGVRITGGMRNNAFYDGDTDAMLFVPYVGKDLPVPVNAGILAHEHFHSLFYKLVMSPLQRAGMMGRQLQGSVHSQEKFYEATGLTRKSKSGDVLTPGSENQLFYHLLLIRGLNEGLADFWGWLYTGDPNFIMKSLADETSRNIQVSQENRTTAFRIQSVQELQSRIMSWERSPRFMMARINSEAYPIGTRYGRIFKAYAEAHAQERGLSLEDSRKDVARQILKTLSSLRMDLLNQTANDYYDPMQFVTSFAAQAESLKKGECEFIANVLNVNSRRTKAYECAAQGDNAVLSKVKEAVVAPPTTPSAATVQPTPQNPVVFAP